MEAEAGSGSRKRKWEAEAEAVEGRLEEAEAKEKFTAVPSLAALNFSAKVNSGQ